MNTSPTEKSRTKSKPLLASGEPGIKSGVKQEKGATLFGSAAPVHSGRQRRPQAVFEPSLCNILTFNVF